jgi:integrase/recombinase XerD
MSIHIQAISIKEFEAHLKASRESAADRRHYFSLANRFVYYLEKHSVAIEAVSAATLQEFLRSELLSWRGRHGRSARDLFQWREQYQTVINRFVALVRQDWPIVAKRILALEASHRDLVEGYEKSMHELRGLASSTGWKRIKHALEFLTASRPHDQEDLKRLGVRDIDAYIQQRCRGLRRTGIESCTVCLRDFLRYLHGCGQTALDLSGAVMGPRIYDHEQIPSALRPEEVRAVLESTRQDSSPVGRRDYAFLILLATYGLRACEVIALRLDDIDWRRDVLHVQHSKTGSHTELPLLNKPGEALLSYLEKVRPRSEYRELFLTLRPPHQPYTSGSILNRVIDVRLQQAGITPAGRRGPHAFRHARAVSLLHSAVPLKVIGDVLGHKSAKSTAVYLKLATEDLRAVGLSIPKEVLR